MAIQAKAVYPQKLGKMYVNNPKLKQTLKKPDFVLWGKKEILMLYYLLMETYLFYNSDVYTVGYYF